MLQTRCWANLCPISLVEHGCLVQNYQHTSHGCIPCILVYETRTVLWQHRYIRSQEHTNCDYVGPCMPKKSSQRKNVCQVVACASFRMKGGSAQRRKKFQRERKFKPQCCRAMSRCHGMAHMIHRDCLLLTFAIKTAFTVVSSNYLPDNGIILDRQKE